MNDNKKENKKPDVKLPAVNSGFEGKHIIYTDKGWFTWHFPINSNFFDSIKYLKYLIKQIELTIEENKKKEKEEYKKVEEDKKDVEKIPVETK